MSELLEAAAPSPSGTRTEVVETCTRMAVHADRREWALLRGLFAERCTSTTQVSTAASPSSSLLQEIVDAWSATLGGYDATQHLIANQLVQVDGDRAVRTASFQATHRLATPHGSSLWTLGGDYRWGLERTGGRWLIDSVVMTATWGTSRPR